MDYLNEYLSIIQSIKTHHIPIVHLNLKLQEKIPLSIESPQESTPSILQPELPIQSITQTLKIQSDISISPPNSSKYALNPVQVSPLLNQSFCTTIKEALSSEIFYEYPPLEISHNKESPSEDLPEVPVFLSSEVYFDKEFIENIISAIQDKFSLSSALVDTQEIEKCNLWRSVTSMCALNCIITYDTWIDTSPRARCWYRAQQKTNNCFLGNIPLVILSSKENWYRDIYNKKVLWNQLCRILKQQSHKRTTIK